MNRETPAQHQSGALSLVGRVEIVLSLVENFKELKYFHVVAPPALLCNKEPGIRWLPCVPKPLSFECDELVLYGIKESWCSYTMKIFQFYEALDQ